MKVFFHDHCFDGAASAAIFSAFHRSRFPDDPVTFQGVGYSPANRLVPAAMDPGGNAVVDYRYVPADQLTWWIDHHRSAFELEGAEAHYQAHRDHHMCFDGTAPSCTGLLARFLEAEHGFDTSPFAELIAWAEIIDAAAFEDASVPVELGAPALRLMLWFAHARDHDERVQVIEHLSQGTIDGAVALPFVAPTLDALVDGQRAQVADFESVSVRTGDVVLCDLLETSVDPANKFIPYYLFPDVPYAVVVTRGLDHLRISAGYNAWHDKAARRHDISVLCARYGGGGHPYVGGVSRELHAVEEIRRIAREMVEALS